jgi:hypothetical protein
MQEQRVKLNPMWLQNLPEHMQPSERAVEELEELKRQHNVSDEELFTRIACSPAMTRKIQYHMYENFRREHKTVPENVILRHVLAARCQVPPGYPAGHIWSDDEVDEAMKSIHDMNELCDVIIGLDSQDPPNSYDINGTGKKINDILENDRNY